MLSEYKFELQYFIDRLNEKEGNAYFKEFANKYNFSNISNIILIGIRSSFNSCLIGKYILEEYAQIPTQTYDAEQSDFSPFFYDKNSLIIIVDIEKSADIISWLDKAKQDGIKIIDIVNDITNIENLYDITIKAYVNYQNSIFSDDSVISQIIILSLIALNIGRYKTISMIEGREIIGNLYSIPFKIQLLFNQIAKIQNIGKILTFSKNICILGNRYNYPITLEASSIFEKKCNINSSVVYASEMKHGPISLISQEMPCIVILCEKKTIEKTISNIIELKARKAFIILITNIFNKELFNIVDYVIELEPTAEIFTPILTLKSIQLIAHFIANEKTQLNIKLK